MQAELWQSKKEGEKGIGIKNGKATELTRLSGAGRQRESFKRHCSDPGSGQTARLLSYENH